MAGSWVFEGRKVGSHVRVTVRSGGPRGAQGKLGDLVMTDDEWAELQDLVDAGHRYTTADFEVQGDGT